MDGVRSVQLSTVNTALHKHFKYSCLYLCFIIFFFLKIIVYCTFYSVCNTDASDVCTIKISYLLTITAYYHGPSLLLAADAK